VIIQPLTVISHRIERHIKMQIITNPDAPVITRVLALSLERTYLGFCKCESNIKEKSIQHLFIQSNDEYLRKEDTRNS